ncbi:CRISPR-associated protein Cas4 [Megamonas hypermegale]|uniref:CRISPR-associated protein Cas4 n=1 Tax=Megamonas hypermegale TaxID=158847 RepID=UPI00243139D4|nr:CRISPR-associated protein Cas4 [Megamonas hypermegale]
MQINGTLVNYYFHCKRQCYLFGNRINFEDNSEDVNIGRALHEERAIQDNTELALENIRLDKITEEYVTETKKSDADVEAAKWQLILYLKILKDKGIVRKGRLEFIEKRKTEKEVIIIELTKELEQQLEKHIKEIEKLLEQDEIPAILNKRSCKKCAYYEFCYI